MALSSDCISRAQLRELAVTTLLNAGTDAQTRVWSPRARPVTPDLLPALQVTTPAERKDSLNRGVPQFNTVVTLAILARVQGKGATTEDMVLDAEDKLERLCAQAEEAILCTPDMVAPVQQFSFVETHMVIDTEAKGVFGEGTVIIGCEVYQLYGPDDGVALTDIRTAIPPDGGTGPSVVFDSHLPQ